MSLPYDCSRIVEIEDEPQHHLVIANEYIRAFAVEIAPHTRTLCHHHPSDYLLYVANAAEIVSAARAEEPKRLSYAQGESESLEAGLVHVVDNLGDEPFRNVVVELLPGMSRLRRGAAPRAIAGAVHVEQVLAESRGAIHRINMQAGAEVEIAGPAVVAAPYAPVLIRELEEYNVPLDGFRKLMWVCAPRKIAVRSPGRNPSEIIVFQIGVATG